MYAKWSWYTQTCKQTHLCIKYVVHFIHRTHAKQSQTWQWFCQPIQTHKCHKCSSNWQVHTRHLQKRDVAFLRSNKITKTYIGAQLPVKNLSYFCWESYICDSLQFSDWRREKVSFQNNFSIDEKREYRILSTFVTLTVRNENKKPFPLRILNVECILFYF